MSTETRVPIGELVDKTLIVARDRRRRFRVRFDGDRFDSVDVEFVPGVMGVAMYVTTLDPLCETMDQQHFLLPHATSRK